MVKQKTINIRTCGRGSIEITGKVDAFIRESGIRQGICNIFVMHTSAALMLCENADPAVLTDMETFMKHIVPDGDPMFRHTTEGPDDMAAHVRSVLSGSDLNLPVNNGHCLLGTWQGVYLWEHRTRPHSRKIVFTIYGEEVE